MPARKTPQQRAARGAELLEAEIVKTTAMLDSLSKARSMRDLISRAPLSTTSLRAQVRSAQRMVDKVRGDLPEMSDDIARQMVRSMFTVRKSFEAQRRIANHSRPRGE